MTAEIIPFATRRKPPPPSTLTLLQQVKAILEASLREARDGKVVELPCDCEERT